MKFIETENQKLQAEKQKLQREIDELKAQALIDKSQVAELKSDKTELKADKLQCSKQLDVIQNLQEDLKSQWKATYIAQTKELRDNLELKLQENVDLTNKLLQKETEIADKNEEIRKLKKKIDSFVQY